MTERDYWTNRAAKQRSLAKVATDPGTSRAHAELAVLLERKAADRPESESRRSA